MSFTQDVALSESEAEAIARGLWAIAAADGVHEREALLISSFWADVGGGVAALAELSRGAPISSAELASSLSNESVRGVFLQTALLLAWSDGGLSEPERALIDEYATALGATAEDLVGIESEVKEFLLSHLAHLHNSSSVAEVAKKLSL